MHTPKRSAFQHKIFEDETAKIDMTMDELDSDITLLEFNIEMERYRYDYVFDRYNMKF